MTDTKLKVKEVYLPFLIVSVGTILFYNLFRWTFDIKLGVLPLKDDLLNFWLPFALPWIPIMIWLRRRIRILAVRGKQDNGHFLYQLVMTLAIAAPIIVSQNYIEKASYELIEVDKISDVKNFAGEKYFKVDSFRVSRDRSLPHATARTSGRNNETLTFYLYFSCPFESSDNIWYGVEYSKHVSNRASDGRKESDYRSFMMQSQKKFESFDFQKLKYFEKLGYSDDRDGFIAAIKRGTSQTIERNVTILVPKSDEFEERLGSTLLWVFRSFAIGAFVLLLMIMIPKIDQKELDDFRKNRPLTEDDLRHVLEFLDPRGPHRATAILIILNIVVFVGMVLSGMNIVSPTPQEVLEIGANRRQEVLNGEYWRLITSVFIHGGLMHILMNMVGLGLGGGLLEEILGHRRLFIIYVLCGILASLASIYWHENTISVGASGAIFGLYGLILAFNVFNIYPDHLRRFTWILLGLYAGVSLLLGLFGGIDNAAHVGGLIGGFVIGGGLVLLDGSGLKERAK